MNVGDLIEELNTIPADYEVEFGRYYAMPASEFLPLENNSIKKIYSIDPWQGGYSNRDPAALSDMKAVEAKFDRQAGYNDKVEKMKMTSLDASQLFSDGSLDIVYIDGDHSYEAVKTDVISWKLKVKNGGLLCGHDYCFGKVVRALNEVMERVPDQTFADNSWLYHI